MRHLHDFGGSVTFYTFLDPNFSLRFFWLFGVCLKSNFSFVRKMLHSLLLIFLNCH